MHQFKRLFVALAIVEITAINLPINVASMKAIAVSNKPTVQAQQSSVVDQISALFDKRPRRGGTRSGEICVINPGSEAEKFWSDRPLFVWQGAQVAKIEIQLEADETPIWTQAVAENDQSLRYQGQPLTAGQTYRLVGFDQSGNLLTPKAGTQIPIFTILNADQQHRLLHELTVKEQSLKANNATAEIIALERAKYFAENGLWSDAFQVIYAMENASLEVKNFIRDESLRICQKDKLM